MRGKSFQKTVLVSRLFIKLGFLIIAKTYYTINFDASFNRIQLRCSQARDRLQAKSTEILVILAMPKFLVKMYVSKQRCMNNFFFLSARGSVV